MSSCTFLQDPAKKLTNGDRVYLETAAPHSQKYNGTLFTADRVTNIVVISTPATGTQASDFHLIQASRIASFKIESRNPAGSTSFNDAVPSIGPIDIKEAERREAQAVAHEKEKLQRRKQGITAEAEDLYTAIERM